jgi:hypothetical protein
VGVDVLDFFEGSEGLEYLLEGVFFEVEGELPDINLYKLIGVAK